MNLVSTPVSAACLPYLGDRCTTPDKTVCHKILDGRFTTMLKRSRRRKHKTVLHERSDCRFSMVLKNCGLRKTLHCTNQSSNFSWDGQFD